MLVVSTNNDYGTACIRCNDSLIAPVEIRQRTAGLPFMALRRVQSAFRDFGSSRVSCILSGVPKVSFFLDAGCVKRRPSLKLCGNNPLARGSRFGLGRVC